MKFSYASSREIEPDWKSKDIMKILECNWSHVLHIIRPSVGEKFAPFIWHSTGEGVNTMLLSKFLETHVLVHEFDFTERLIVHPERLLGYFEGNEGKDYSETQYLGFLPDAFGPVKKWMQSKVDDNQGELICSEFTSRSANKYTTLKIKGDEDFIDPKMFIEQIMKYGLKNVAPAT